MCNGHADACVQRSQDDNSQFECRCKHLTCGIKCQECCPGFVQKKWKPATPDNNNECERELYFCYFTITAAIITMLHYLMRS